MLTPPPGGAQQHQLVGVLSTDLVQWWVGCVARFDGSYVLCVAVEMMQDMQVNLSSAPELSQDQNDSDSLMLHELPPKDCS